MPLLSLPISWSRAVGGWLAGAFTELFPTVVTSDVAAAQAGGWHIDDPAAYCPRCGASTGPGEVTQRGCSRCAAEPIAWDRLVRLSAYKPPMASWIVAMKFHKQWSWAPWLGTQLARMAGPIEKPAATLVCHVPMPWRRRFRRGYSQAWLIADAFARSHKLREADILRRRGWQAPQMTMHTHAEREANVRHAFRIEPVDMTGCHVWLIDDVKTSGTTLSRCARLLREAGAEKINVAVAAVADPKHADFKAK